MDGRDKGFNQLINATDPSIKNLINALEKNNLNGLKTEPCIAEI